MSLNSEPDRLSPNLYALGDYYIKLYRQKDGWWSADVRPPHTKKWGNIGTTCPEKEGSLEEAIVYARREIREQYIVGVLGEAITALEDSGYSFAEILNGLAELAYRKDLCNAVVYNLEEASGAAM